MDSYVQYGFRQIQKGKCTHFGNDYCLGNGCSDMRSLQEELTDCSVAILVTQFVLQTQKVVI
jgi:hypothetical protein